MRAVLLLFCLAACDTDTVDHVPPPDASIDAVMSPSDASPPDAPAGQNLEWRCHCQGYPIADDLFVCGRNETEAIQVASSVNCPPGWTCVAGDQPDWSC